MFLKNTMSNYGRPLLEIDQANFSAATMEKVDHFLAEFKEARDTALISLTSLADHLNIAQLSIKDESTRLGLGSFKAMGGAYAVVDLILSEASRRLGRKIDFNEMHSPAVRDIAKTITVGCATDGNHGKSVAAGAKIIGANAAIFVHSGVTDERVNAIAQYGATMIRVDGTYDDSVSESERVCRERNWQLVSDTSWPGYETIPSVVMQGYTRMLREAMDQMGEIPTHVFVQAGVGGLAAAVSGFFSVVYGDKKPTIICVEPNLAACIFESAKVGRPIKIHHDEPTIMAMLECYEPSMVAWRIIERTIDGFCTVTDEEAKTAIRTLADPIGHDQPIVAGESGAAGLAGLINVLADPEAKHQMGLGRQSRVMLINTEFATDRDRYEAIVGKSPELVLA